MLQGLKEIFLKFDTDKASGQDTSFFIQNMIYHVNTETQFPCISFVFGLDISFIYRFYEHEDTHRQNTCNSLFSNDRME